MLVLSLSGFELISVIGPRSRRTVLGSPNWGEDVVAIATLIQNNSGRP